MSSKSWYTQKLKALTTTDSLNLSHPLGRELAYFFRFLVYKHNGDSEVQFWAGAWRPMDMAVLINPFTLVVLQRLRFEPITFFLSHRFSHTWKELFFSGTTCHFWTQARLNYRGQLNAGWILHPITTLPFFLVDHKTKGIILYTEVSVRRNELFYSLIFTALFFIYNYLSFELK